MRGVGAAVLALSLAALVSPAPAAATSERQVLLFLVDGISYEDALEDSVLARLAAAGGVALLATPPGDEARTRADVLALRRVAGVDVMVLGDTSRVGPSIQQGLEAMSGELLVIVVVPSASAAMRKRGDNVTPLIVAQGSAEEILPASGALAGLTSDTTRREGVISNVDIRPTVLEFVRMPFPEEMAGSPIRIQGEAPTDLHRRYLEYRRVVTPIGVIVLLSAIASLVASLILLLGPWSPPRSVAAALAGWGLISVALLVALLPASILPGYAYPLVLGVLAAGAAVIAAVGVGLGRADPVAPVAIVAGIGLGLVVVDALLGWPSGLTPLMGGSALDGVRFYGLGNSYAGVVLAGATLVAARVDPWPGGALIAAAALFAGLPFLGSDLGGGVTLFAVAGMWYALRVRGRLDLRGWAVAAGTAVAGLALLLVAHRLLPPGGTHVSRAVESAEGPAGLLSMFADRLALNLEATAATPAVWLALVGLPAWLFVAVRRSGPFRATLSRAPEWRDGIIALALGGMIGFVLNDTYGMASVAFVFLSAALVYPALEARWKGG